MNFLNLAFCSIPVLNQRNVNFQQEWFSLNCFATIAFQLTVCLPTLNTKKVCWCVNWVKGQHFVQRLCVFFLMTLTTRQSLPMCCQASWCVIHDQTTVLPPLRLIGSSRQATGDTSVLSHGLQDALQSQTEPNVLWMAQDCSRGA